MADSPQNCYLFVPDPQNFPPELHQKLIEQLATQNLKMILEGTGPYTPCPTPTDFLFRAFEFLVDDQKQQVSLREKLLRTRIAVLETIPDPLRRRYQHMPCRTLIPFEVGWKEHGYRPPDRIQAFCVFYRRVDKIGRPPDIDDSILPFGLDIDGVMYQREMPEKKMG